MKAKTVGLLHPGDMGVTVGAAAATSGARVVWASHGRSPATRERARQAGLHDVVNLADLVRASDIIICVCPPHAALDVAGAVAAQGFRGIYVDANAVSPATAERIGATVSQAGASFVDGGLIGRAARQAGTTRLYLAGERAAEVAALFTGSVLEAKVLTARPGSASALKMAYAAWTKGSNALLLAIRALAATQDVEQALLEEWGRSQPELLKRSVRAAERAAPKGWRYVGEMQEIAATFDAAGLPAGFHLAAADLYGRLAGLKDFADLATAPAAVSETLRMSAQRHRP